MSELGEPLRKKSGKKIGKTAKIQVKLQHVNKKPLARNRIFVQTPFSAAINKLPQPTAAINKLKHLSKPLKKLFKKHLAIN